MIEGPLGECVDLMTLKEVELQAKGYQPLLVDAAIKRALGAATYKTKPISQEIRDQAMLDVLRHELDGAERWLQREMKLIG